jgi:hypothetical protein
MATRPRVALPDLRPRHAGLGDERPCRYYYDALSWVATAAALAFGLAVAGFLAIA